MRRRITRALVAAAAAGVTVTTLGLTAGSASASTARPAAFGVTIGSPIATENAAGYEASGRYFRYISALITTPDVTHFTSVFPAMYIQLSNGSLNSTGEPTGDQFTRAGIMPCKNALHAASVFGYTFSCYTSKWVAFIESFNNSIFQPYFVRFVPINVQPGDGVFFSIFYNEAGNELQYVITSPQEELCSGASVETYSCYYKTQAYGPIFDHAAGLVDFTDTATGQPVPLPPWASQFRITQFLEGALTTYVGNRGSWVGPWTTSLVEATSNGELFPYGHVRVSPSFLWKDGLTNNGAARDRDAFGVWARV